MVCRSFVANVMFNFGQNDDETLLMQEAAEFCYKEFSKGIMAGKTYTEMLDPVGELAVMLLARKKKELAEARLARLRARQALTQKRGDVCEGRVLNVLPAEHWLRRGMYKVVETPVFQWFIVVAILLNCVCLALENPSLDPDGDLMHVLRVSDLVFAVLFTVEALMKILATGFYAMDGAYLTEGWNQLDFFIVVVSLVNLAVSFPLLKIMRALRPMRLVVRISGVKAVVLALGAALPATGNVLTLTFLFCLIFSIMGVSLFKGLFRRPVGESPTQLAASIHM